MICGENFDSMNQPDILPGRVKPRVARVGPGRVDIFQPERTSELHNHGKYFMCLLLVSTHRLNKMVLERDWGKLGKPGDTWHDILEHIQIG